MRTLILFCLLNLLAGGIPAWAQSQPIDAVNLKIGTSGEGQTFPATGVPFAMTHWTPQTRDGEVKCVAPYYAEDTRIQGFRGSHFLSGSCTQDYGSVTIMPLSGELKLGAKERSSAFSRDSEKSSPDRYAVTLSDYGIDAEITGTTRAGLMKFTFQHPGKSWMLVQSNARQGEGSVRIDPARQEVTGINPVHRLYAGNGKPAGFSGYFVAQFDHNFQIGGTWTGKQVHEGATQQDGVEGEPGAYLLFDLKPGEVVQVRIGTSFTSIEEARHNLEAEIPGWNFEQVAASAQTKWNSALSSIQVGGAPTQRTIFYTALYHSLLLPRTFSDANGNYPSFAGGERIETAKDFTYYTDFSIWDTFRALHPLLTILDPSRERDMIQSLIAQGQQGGFLPIFPAWNSYTQEMVGDHAVSIIGDAYLKGIRGFDIDEAYRLMRKNATQLPESEELYRDGRGRRALKSYLQYGYIPLEDHVTDAFHQNEQVSRTLEYAYDDFVIAEVAKSLGKSEDAQLFSKRAQNYRNVIDPQTGYARGRHADGSWDSPFDPAGKYTYITEGLPYQYTFFVPQDIPGLIQQVGGRNAFIQKLDSLFTGNYYDHGNEPSHHIAYLYNYAGAAWKTQKRVHDIQENQYFNRPKGVAGNDDCGQMSAWYVLSALGFYSVTPGLPRYEIGTPFFDDANISLPGGRHFHIKAEGASKGKFFIQSAKLNGTPLKRSWISHEEIISGGELVFEMSSHPNYKWPGN